MHMYFFKFRTRINRLPVLYYELQHYMIACRHVLFHGMYGVYLRIGSTGLA